MNRGKVYSIGLLAGLVLTLLLGGCSPQPTQVLHPPAWIQGTWTFGNDLDGDYEFTATTVVMRAGKTSLDLGEMYRLSHESIQEVVTASLYSFAIVTIDGSITYEFAKIDASSLGYTIRGPGLSKIGPVTLYRQ